MTNEMMSKAFDRNVLACRYAGKILLRSEIDLPDPLFMQLLKAHFFQQKPSMTITRFTITCNRCGNKKKSLIGTIPCQQCHKTHPYCRQCIEMGRVLACQPLYVWTGIQPKWPNIEHPITWKGELTKNQQLAADRMKLAIINQEKEILTWAVCGSGKTEMIFPAITAAIKRKKRICIATPRADVVRELLPRLKQAFHEVTIEGLYGGSKEKIGTSQIILSTTHQLIRYMRAFDVVIIDEVDAFPYHQEPMLPYVTKRALKKNGTMMYLTATPRKDLHKRIQNKTIPHVFIPTRFHGHPLPVPKMKLIFDLNKQLKSNKLPSAFFTWLKQRKKQSRQLLLFVPTISLAEQLAAYLTPLLIKTSVIKHSHELSFVHAEDKNREEKIEKFRKRDIYFLITTTILERGVTFPSVDVAVIDAGNHVFDEAALVQIAGRAGRSQADPDGEVIFFHDGKTNAMCQAIDSIKKMNKIGGL